MTCRLIGLFNAILGLLAILLFIVAFVLCENPPNESLSKEYYVKVTKGSKISLLAQTATRFGLKYIRQASPNVHIFSEKVGENHDGNFRTPQISNLSALFGEKITDVQEVIQNQVRQIQPPINLQRRSLIQRLRRAAYFMKKCKPYYGMDIEEAWALNYTGYGINVGILDLGFEINHPDLKRNINAKLGYNFVDRERRYDFLPNYESKNYQEADKYVDHGNNIAGLIAAVKGNELCSAGVAYNASVVPLVVFRLDWFPPDFDDTYIPKALSHANQKIHIYSNSYNNKNPFVKPSLPLLDSLETGVIEGRKGNGSIFVFSLGDNADQLWDGNTDFFANSIHTITIGSVGQNGTVPKYSIPCACVLASALSDGNTIDSDSMTTTSQDNSCRDNFKGNSAATAIGASIIALGLLDRLSWRDVQYILIFTSSLENLKSKLPITENGKGLKYNPYFGFGMMNATSFSMVARSWISVPQQVLSTFYHSKRTRLISRSRSKDPDAFMTKVIVKECEDQSHCVRNIEHVVAEITYVGTREKLVSFSLYSPSNTKSVLLHSAQETWPKLSKQMKMKFRRTWKFTSVQFWGESPVGDWILIMTQYDTMTNKSYIMEFGFLRRMISVAFDPMSTEEFKMTRETTNVLHNVTLNGLRKYSVSPHVHVFSEEIDQEQPWSPSMSQISNFSAFFHAEIKAVQEVEKNRVRYFRPPTEITGISRALRFKRTASFLMTCDPYYGMEIEEAWAFNFTGYGINIAVLDVGIETDHTDLQKNIDTRLGFNFVDPEKRSDFLPNYESQNYPEVSDFMNHGTNIAGLIASIQGNEMCSAGIAFNAKIVPLVVFKFEERYLPLLHFDDKHIPAALVHANQEIHIYSNSYSYKKPFVNPSLSLLDSLETGTSKGRSNKGSIFVFALGDNTEEIWDGNADSFANSLHTITIGSVGKNGSVPYYSIPCACVLVSALSEGNTLDSDTMHTTSQQNSCRDDFGGNSAATGMSAAIIGLGLNDRLSWRDVQYILISTSSMEGLRQKLPSTVNAKGFKYNPHFGFGMINATAFATVAKSWTPVPQQILSVFYAFKRIRLTSKPKSKEPDAFVVNIKVEQCEDQSVCVRYVEQIVAEITYTASRDKLVSFSLYSPSKTQSVLLHNAQETWRGLLKQERRDFRRTWKFSSVQFWGESPFGDWILIMTQYDKKSDISYKYFTVHDCTLFIYGTSTDPFKDNEHHSPHNQDDTNNNPTGLTDIIQTQDELSRVFYEVIEGDTDSILDECIDSRKNELVTYILAFVVLVTPFPLIAACCMSYAVSIRERVKEREREKVRER